MGFHALRSPKLLNPLGSPPPSGFIEVATDSTGKSVDNSELSVGPNIAERQRINIGDPTSATGLAAVQAAQAAATDIGVVVDPKVNTSSRAAKANVAVSASSPVSQTILLANSQRSGATIYNESAFAILYLDLSGGVASTTSYSLQVAPGSTFSLPAMPIYTGKITGAWSPLDASGNARVTENT